MKSENSTAQIKCTSYSHIQFSQSQRVHITNLDLIGCGGNLVEEVEEFVVRDSKFEGQESSGTALELIETIAQIVNSTFANRRAIIATDSSIDINQSVFENNRAGIGGAILAEQNSVINLSGNVFINNSAYFLGGVLHSNSSTIIIKASEFFNNSADYGGVLHSGSSTITIEASEFNNNSADYGGVLLSDSSTITIEASEFNNNSADYGGVLDSGSSTITIEASEFNNNSADYGGVLDSDSSTITIEASEFNNNSADYGGVLDSDSSTITIEASEFNNNSADYGGVLDSGISTITIEASEFNNNSADYGGVLDSDSSTITIEASEFNNNSADYGGVLDSDSSTITIEASEFNNNSADYGGVLDSDSSTITIEASEFNNNSADYGGVLLSDSSTITIGGSNFTKNVSPIGAVIYATDRSKIRHNHKHLLIDNNMADRYVVIYLFDSEFIGHDSENVITFSNNLGSLVAFNSNITLNGHALFVNNQPPQTASGDFQKGGAITLRQSNAFFYGTCNLEHNHAENGGAIHSTESKLYVYGNVTLAHNTATGNGGGVYLSTSELNCQHKSTLKLFNNTAEHKGGGLHANSSSIKATSSFSQGYTGARMNFKGNTANRGGGLSLEANAKLYILKYNEVDYYVKDDTNTTTFTANSADYGGAIYVDDHTNSGTCASDTKTECFFQVLAIYSTNVWRDVRIQSIYFLHNFANTSGATLYGGLLDRCAVSQFAEFYQRYPLDNKDGGDAIAYFRNVTIPNTYEEVVNDTNLSVSSLPV